MTADDLQKLVHATIAVNLIRAERKMEKRRTVRVISLIFIMLMIIRAIEIVFIKTDQSQSITSFFIQE